MQWTTLLETPASDSVTEISKYCFYFNKIFVLPNNTKNYYHLTLCTTGLLINHCVFFLHEVN